MKISHLTIKRLNDALMKGLCVQAAGTPRKRVNFNFHESSSDLVQRFLNVMQPDTYVRPHRHIAPPKWEMTVALSGRAVVLVMDANGAVHERIELDAMGPERGIELPAGVWHTCAALEADTVLLEIKIGPYKPLVDKEFAAWAPPEGAAECADFLNRFRAALPGAPLHPDRANE